MGKHETKQIARRLHGLMDKSHFKDKVRVNIRAMCSLMLILGQWKHFDTINTVWKSDLLKPEKKTEGHEGNNKPDSTVNKSSM